MIKRLMLIGLLALTLVPLSRTKANAQGACEPTLLAFYGICVVMNISDFSVEAGSVDVSSIIRQLQNAGTSKPAYEAVLFIEQVLALCKNPAGKSEVANNGQPFNLAAILSQTQAINANQITKNGRFLSDLKFSDADLIAAITAALGTVCKDKWKLVDVAVTQLQVVGTLFTCEAGGDPKDPRNTGCVIADSLGKECSVPSGQDPFKTPFNYSCNTVCTGTLETNPTGDYCPQPVAGNPLYPTS